MYNWCYRIIWIWPNFGYPFPPILLHFTFHSQLSLASRYCSSIVSFSRLCFGYNILLVLTFRLSLNSSYLFTRYHHEDIYNNYYILFICFCSVRLCKSLLSLNFRVFFVISFIINFICIAGFLVLIIV